MGLTALYNFNENDTSNVRDYSGNGNHSTGITGTLVIQNSDIGKEGVFDETDKITLPVLDEVFDGHNNWS